MKGSESFFKSFRRRAVSNSIGSARGRHVLACASGGGHFKQLVQLVQRIPDTGPITWFTYDTGLSADLLRGAGRERDRIVYAPYAGPRDVRNLARDARVARQLLREEHYDLAISTGAGLAVAVLPIARSMGIRTCFIETAARTNGPSMSGRILRRTPGIEFFTQNEGYPKGWRYAGSVHAGFEAGPEHSLQREIKKVVVALGTSEIYGFPRLVRRLTEILPDSIEVLWQTGVTNTQGLDIDGHVSVPGPELERAIRDADVLVAHAGVGSTLTAFELGCFPILVPRRRAFGENIDDHQAVTARALAERGLAYMVEADEISMRHLEDAARKSVVPVENPPQLPI